MKSFIGVQVYLKQAIYSQVNKNRTLGKVPSNTRSSFCTMVMENRGLKAVTFQCMCGQPNVNAIYNWDLKYCITLQ